MTQPFHSKHCFTQGKWKFISTQTCMWMFIATLFAINGPKLETAQMCINRQLAKQTVEHPSNGILLGNKEWPLIYETAWLNLKIMMLQWRSQIKRVHTICFCYINSELCKFMPSDKTLLRGWEAGRNRRAWLQRKLLRQWKHLSWLSWLLVYVCESHQTVHF